MGCKIKKAKKKMDGKVKKFFSSASFCGKHMKVAVSMLTSRSPTVCVTGLSVKTHGSLREGSGTVSWGRPSRRAMCRVLRYDGQKHYFNYSSFDAFCIQRFVLALRRNIYSFSPFVKCHFVGIFSSAFLGINLLGCVACSRRFFLF